MLSIKITLIIKTEQRSASVVKDIIQVVVANKAGEFSEMCIGDFENIFCNIFISSRSGREWKIVFMADVVLAHHSMVLLRW